MDLEGFAKKIEMRSAISATTTRSWLGTKTKKFPHKMILAIEKNKN